MNIEKMHSLFLKIENEFDSLKIINAITELQTALQTTITNQTPPIIETYKKALDALAEVLTNSAINNLLPSEDAMVKALSIKKYLGSELFERIKATIFDNRIIPAEAVKELAVILKDVDKFDKAISSTIKNFAFLNVPAEVESEEFVEVGMVIPREITTDTLTGLEDELHEVNFIYKTLSEILGENDYEVKVKTISSTDYGLYLLAGGSVAKLLTYLIDKCLDIYKKFQDIRKNESVQKENYSEEIVKLMTAHTEEKLKKSVQEVADEVVKNNYKGTDQTRANELNTAIAVLMRYFINRIGKGATIEIKVSDKQAAHEEQAPSEQGQGEAVATAASTDKDVFKEIRVRAKEINSKLKRASELKGDTPILLIEDEKVNPQEPLK